MLRFTSLRTGFCAALVASGLLSGIGCDSTAAPDQVKEDLELPEFVCPLPVREAVDPGPLPSHDPARAHLLPELARGCEIPSKTMARLNRSQFDNAVRDLLHVDVTPAKDTFPADDTAGGFDTITDVLSTSPLLVEKLMAAGRVVTDAALDDGVPEPTTMVFEAEALFGGNDTDGFHRVSNNASRTIVLTPTWAGTHIFRVLAFEEAAGAEHVRIQLSLQKGDEPFATLGMYEVSGTGADPQLIEVTTHLAAAEYRFRITFLNDYVRPEDRGRPALDRNLLLDFVELEGPYDAEPAEPPPARAALLTCDPEAVGDEVCFEEIMVRVARRAFRRPVEATELHRYLGFLQVSRIQGGTFEDGLRLALRALLMSPEFLFRLELDNEETVAATRLLSDHELATRLSFFIWSSIPDDRLLDLADLGALNDPEVLRAEVGRMLADQRAEAFVRSFAGQWLESRRVPEVALDTGRYPVWDEDFARSAGCETEMLFDDVLRSGGTVQDLLLAEHTFVNHKLARHYGLEEPTTYASSNDHPDAHFVRASLDGTSRRGIITHTGTLALTSNPDRTSPVKRGKWVLDQLLCVPPPPPPPGVEGLVDEEGDGVTLAEQLAQHREDPACAGCHNLMDPIGLGLEHFAPDGSWRDAYGDGLPIDDESELFGHLPFHGALELTEMLAERPELPDCATEKMLTYATGRELDKWGIDQCALEAISDAFDERGHRLDELVALVAESAPFRMRRPPNPVVADDDEFDLENTDEETAP